ncbi:MAG: AlpA family phage regulatory protein [Sedimentisphaerales bacterium]|nr:AlpA family phage regulatory protein [Sedimentisphaerales bacterium]
MSNRQTTNQVYQLWDAKTFGQRLSLSKRQIFRLNACGKIPAPIRIGGSVRWLSEDITAWIDMGCPNRHEFESRKGINNVE